MKWLLCCGALLGCGDSSNPGDGADAPMGDAAAAQASTWSAVSPLEAAPAAPLTGVGLAANASGTAIVTFGVRDGSGPFVAARRYTPATGTWTATVLVQESLVSEAGLVAMDDAGNALVAGTGGRLARLAGTAPWETGWSEQPVLDHLRYVTGLRMTGSGWAAVVGYFNSIGDEGPPQCSNATALYAAPGAGWALVDRSGGVLMCSEQLPMPVIVSGGIGLGGDGHVVAPLVDDHRLLLTTTWPERARTTDATHTAESSEDAAVSAAGDVGYALTVRTDGTRQLIGHRFVTEWHEARVDAGPGTPSRGRVAINGAGTAVLAWLQCASSCTLWARLDVGGALQPAHELGPAADEPPALAIDDSGNAYVLWLQGDDTIVASELSAGSWRAPHALTAPASGARTAPRLVVDARGHGLAAWEHMASAVEIEYALLQ